VCCYSCQALPNDTLTMDESEYPCWWDRMTALVWRTRHAKDPMQVYYY
jgi:hypothetical protein